jgi:hypothetical protein
MHSYIKTSGGNYSVGLWLVSGDNRGCVFSKLFDVDGFPAAVTAVNMLNGGDTTQVFKVLKEH